MQAGNEALLIFRELGHRPTEGTVAYRLAAVARGLGRPRAARRYAELAVAAGSRQAPGPRSPWATSTWPGSTLMPAIW